MPDDAEPQLVTASYTIPDAWKRWIESAARRGDLNASQVVRQIIREHFERKGINPEAELATAATPA